MIISGHEFEITKPDKILFPGSKITKQMVIDYYIKVAPKMLKYIEDRPLTLQRYPEGIDFEGFYQKDAIDYFPSWIKTVNVPLIKGGSIDMIVADDKSVLAYLAHQYTITFHSGLSRAGHLKNPDYIVFDLDPSDNDFKKVIKSAKILHDVLNKEGYKPWLMTTGSRGLHIIAPLKNKMTFDKSRDEARRLAEIAVANDQNLMTLEIRKNKRQNRVYIDIMRNAYGQTHVAPYSLRARPGAPIAMPISWNELDDPKLTPTRYTIADYL